MEKEKDVKIELKKYYERQLMLSCLILVLSTVLFIMTIGRGTLLSYILGFFTFGIFYMFVFNNFNFGNNNY